MSKLAIIVCALIVASAVQASVVERGNMGRSLLSSAQERLQKEKDRIDSTIDKLVNWINEKVRTAEADANKVMVKLREQASTLEDGVREQVEDALDNVDQQIQDATEQAAQAAQGWQGDLDVSECTNLLAGVRDAVLDVLVDVGVCINGQIDQGAGYIKSMTETTDKILDQLIEIKATADECIRDVDGIASALKAVVCVNAAGVRATWAAAKQVPSLVTDSAKLAVMVASLPPTLTYCVASNSFATIEERLNDAIYNVRACIAEKLNEANENQRGGPTNDDYPAITQEVF